MLISRKVGLFRKRMKLSFMFHGRTLELQYNVQWIKFFVNEKWRTIRDTFTIFHSNNEWDHPGGTVQRTPMNLTRYIANTTNFCNGAGGIWSKRLLRHICHYNGAFRRNTLALSGMLDTVCLPSTKTNPSHEMLPVGWFIHIKWYVPLNFRIHESLAPSTDSMSWIQAQSSVCEFRGRWSVESVLG